MKVTRNGMSMGRSPHQFIFSKSALIGKITGSVTAYKKAVNLFSSIGNHESIALINIASCNKLISSHTVLLITISKISKTKSSLTHNKKQQAHASHFLCEA